MVWALQHVPYLQQLSAEEERTRRRARLHKLQAANAEAQLEVPALDFVPLVCFGLPCAIWAKQWR